MLGEVDLSGNSALQRFAALAAEEADRARGTPHSSIAAAAAAAAAVTIISDVRSFPVIPEEPSSSRTQSQQHEEHGLGKSQTRNEGAGASGGSYQEQKALGFGPSGPAIPPAVPPVPGSAAAAAASSASVHPLHGVVTVPDIPLLLLRLIDAAAHEDHPKALTKLRRIAAGLDTLESFTKGRRGEGKAGDAEEKTEGEEAKGVDTQGDETKGEGVSGEKEEDAEEKNDAPGHGDESGKGEEAKENDASEPGGNGEAAVTQTGEELGTLGSLGKEETSRLIVETLLAIMGGRHEEEEMGQAGSGKGEGGEGMGSRSSGKRSSSMGGSMGSSGGQGWTKGGGPAIQSASDGDDPATSAAAESSPSVDSPAADPSSTDSPDPAAVPSVIITSSTAKAATQPAPEPPARAKPGAGQLQVSPRTRMARGIACVLLSCTRNRALCASMGLVRALLAALRVILLGGVDSQGLPPAAATADALLLPGRSGISSKNNDRSSSTSAGADETGCEGESTPVTPLFGVADEAAWDCSPLVTALECLAAHSLNVAELQDWVRSTEALILPAAAPPAAANAAVSAATAADSAAADAQDGPSSRSGLAGSSRAALLLTALERAMAGEEARGPSHSFELDGRTSGLLGPGDSKWPFGNGYAVATWLYVESFVDTSASAITAAAKAAAIAAAITAKGGGKGSAQVTAAQIAAAVAAANSNILHLPRLYSFLTIENHGIEAYFHKDTLVVESNCPWTGIRNAVRTNPPSGLLLNSSQKQTGPAAHHHQQQRQQRLQCPLFAELGPVYIFKEPIGSERIARLAVRGGDHLPVFGAGAGAPAHMGSELMMRKAEESCSLDVDLAPSIHLLYHPKMLLGSQSLSGAFQTAFESSQEKNPFHVFDACRGGQQKWWGRCMWQRGGEGGHGSYKHSAWYHRLKPLHPTFHPRLFPPGVQRRPAEVVGQVHVAARRRAADALWAAAEGGPVALLPLCIEALDLHSMGPQVRSPPLSLSASQLLPNALRIIARSLRRPMNREELKGPAPALLSHLLHFVLSSPPTLNESASNESAAEDTSGSIDSSKEHSMEKSRERERDRDKELVHACMLLAHMPRPGDHLKNHLMEHLLLHLPLWAPSHLSTQRALLAAVGDAVSLELQALQSVGAVSVHKVGDKGQFRKRERVAAVGDAVSLELQALQSVVAVSVREGWSQVKG
ncbi:unnamed protein product [Closterium sp. NIES-65]|nr:unnamed protein product [Closterium sp. NIES-65]